ncbi:MAG: DUF1343 domain-containing protein [Verrucomicrobiales bacterium]|nr:DUF1343 domain-containing protein [Verrucomicrobiales bacterium]
MIREYKSFFAAALAATIVLVALLSCETTPAGGASRVKGQVATYRGPVKFGIDVLEENGFDLLRGKRVGLITNQTSVNRRGEKTRLVLKRAPQVNLTALYAPEHGLEGTEKAAVHIDTRRDPLTGLIAYSLYGPTRKPTPEMLAGIDVMLFDLQDIGSRSYTYISTMIRAMEACAENGKEFVVLDRPNPLGGLRVQGPPIESQWISFVGQVPTPYIHGMTAGELAQMANGKGWIARPCRLTVVPVLGWNRAMSWEHTGLRWVPTSPNIPKPSSPRYYAATGILGSLSGSDIGIGSDGPFEYVGGPGFDANEFTAYLNSLRLPGVRFTPYTRNSFSGARVSIDANAPVDLAGLNLIFIDAVNRRIGQRNLFVRTSANNKDVFYKVYGSTSIERDLPRGVHPAKIIASWQGAHEAFRRERQPYLIYE